MIKKITTICFLSIAITSANAQSTIPTTTVNGSLRITDSLNVTNDISSTGDISTTGNMNAASLSTSSMTTTELTTGHLNVTAGLEAIAVAAGEVTANDTMRAKKDLLIDGNTVIGGNLRVGGLSTITKLSVTDKLILGGNMALKAVSNPVTGVTDFNLGEATIEIDPVKNFAISPCFSTPNISSLNYQNGKMTFWGGTGTNTKALTIGHDGTQSFIDATGGDGATGNRLLINYYCGKDIYMCTGIGFVDVGTSNGLAGGVVGMGPNVEIGMPTRNKQIALNMLVKGGMLEAIKIKNKMGSEELDVFSVGAKGSMKLISDLNNANYVNALDIKSGFGTGIDVFSVGARGGAKLTTTDVNPNFSGFITPYALSVFNRNKNREVLKVANKGTINLYTDNTTPDGAVVVNNVDANKNVFKIFSDGKTQIGAGTPKVGGLATNAMLSVDGLVLAHEVKIAIANTHWADYVFNANYNLKPLTEVEAYITKHKHLPNVPSTSDVEANGINVVEMQATLLQKIEELTLYLLQENKRITKLEKENAELKQLLKK